MAEENQGEKTEDPSSRKLDEARKKGQVAVSREVGAWLGLAATGAVLAMRLAARLGMPVARTTDAPLSALLPAFHETLLFLAGLALLAALVSTARGAPAEAAARQSAPVETGI